MKLSLSTRKVGKPPGHFSSQIGPKNRVDNLEILSFSAKTCFESVLSEAEVKNLATLTLNKSSEIHWIITNEPFHPEVLEEYSTSFGMPAMFVEDILNPYHRPKIENHEDGILVILRSLYHEKTTNDIFEFQESQLTLWKYRNTVTVFCSQPIPFFHVLKDQIKTGKGKIRQKKSDYLLYSILDLVIDHYYVVASEFYKQIERIEASAAHNISSALLTDIYSKIDLLNYLRKWIFPLKDSIVVNLTHNHIGIGSENNALHTYYKDIIDHLNQILDSLDSYKDVLVNLLNLQLALNSYKMNQIMKTLTLISSIFIPLTFLVGVYGMNFKFMPEIDKEWAYPAFWGVTIVLSSIMLVIFKRKKYF